MLTEELENIARTEDLGQIQSKCKAIYALFPYAIRRERGGDHWMADAFLGIARSPKIGTLMTQAITALSGEPGRDTDVTVRGLGEGVRRKHSHLVGCGSLNDPVYRGCRPECSRYAAANRVPWLPTTVHPCQHLGMVEEAAVSPANMHRPVGGNNGSHRS